jgi:carbonic anhydrase
MRGLVIVAMALALAACGGGGGDDEDAHGEDAAHQEAAHGEAPHWTYAEQANWGALSADNAACSAGEAQSPIDLTDTLSAGDLPDLAIALPGGEGALINNGHTLQFTTAPGPWMTIGADAYTLDQFHFHAPSEHSVDGRRYPAEIHFVHRNEAGGLAVVGVFIEPGEENPALAQLLASLPSGEGEAAATRIDIEPSTLLPNDRLYFAYAGSLTTPPCSEGVRWNVLRTPITASEAQIDALTLALGATARDVQPLHQRQVAFGD